MNIELVVSFFIDKTLEYQAMIFSTINRTQKRVSDSLVSSLFGLNTDDSPQKTALQIVLALNAHQNSPFFNRINLYGNSYEKNQSPPLSQAGMVKSIVDLISENIRESEKDRFKSRKELTERSISSNKYLPFRNYYASSKDENISNIFFHYFNAVRRVFKDSNSDPFWDFSPETMKPTNVLQTTIGYLVLLRILIELLKEIKEPDRYDSKIYEQHLAKAKHIEFDNLKRYPFTSKSQSVLYYDLSLSIWPPHSQDDTRIHLLNEVLNKNP